MKAQRNAYRFDRQNQLNIHSYLTAKNTYFLEIKRAKRKHWNQFLEKSDPKSIFKAMSYTKDNRIERIPLIRQSVEDPLVTDFQEQAKCFRKVLFPPPPITDEINYSKYRPNQWQ